MNTIRKKILILGIGNYLMQDEGVGVHFARMMEKETLPEEIEVLDGGTGGFHLLEYLDDYPKVIIVDATLDDKPAGTIRRLQPRFAQDFPRAMSTHDIGLKDLVGALQLLGRMPSIDLYVVSIASIQEQGIELSEEAKKVLPVLKDLILQRIKEIRQDELKVEAVI